METKVYVYVQSKVGKGFQFVPFKTEEQANRFIELLKLNSSTLEAWIFDFNK